MNYSGILRTSKTFAQCSVYESGMREPPNRLHSSDDDKNCDCDHELFDDSGKALDCYVRFRYSENLKDAKQEGVKRGAVAGFGGGMIFFMVFCAFSLAFWYGSSLVRDGEYTGGTVLLVSDRYKTCFFQAKYRLNRPTARLCCFLKFSLIQHSICF